MYDIVALAARTFGDSYDQIMEMPYHSGIKIDLRSLLEGREVMIHLLPEAGETKERALDAAQPPWYDVEVYDAYLNPYYHSSRDTIDKLDFTKAGEFVKVGN